MLPLSLGRTSSSSGVGPREIHPSIAWLRPPNITSASSAEVHALVSWLAFCVTVGVAIAVGHVWVHLKVFDLGYRLSATRQVIEKLEQEGHELAVEAATLDTPGRLEEVARLRLGMIRPEKGQEVALP
jgi:cell division protein FtsL